MEGSVQPGGVGQGSPVLSPTSTGQTSAFERFRTTLIYDAITRLPLVLWFAICAWGMGHRLYADFMAADTVDAKLVLDLLARATGMAFVLIVILALSLRRPAVARSAGILPRLVAFAGTFSLTPLALLAPVSQSLFVSAVSLILVCVGYIFACYTLLHLGRSLSMMAEARKLVISGPYAFVRHPLYTAEAIASLGLLLQYLTLPAVALWVFHIALQLTRIQYEETILSKTFPDYKNYAKRVPRLLPGVY
ncbi:MAG: isoprenylcysteine carboxylmethyltransferase family protein [Pseudomonadota bacterium]